MEVIVHEQEKRFYLATADGWVSLAGHEITIDKHSFCATPNPSRSVVIFSEVTSGAKILEVNLNILDAILMDTKRKYLEFINEQSRGLVDLLSRREDLSGEIMKAEFVSISKLGPKPPTEDIDMDELKL